MLGEVNSCTTARTSTAPTADQLEAAIRETKNLRIRHENARTPDVILMTPEVEWALREQAAAAKHASPAGIIERPSTLYGIPFEVYASQTEMRARALELRDSGKRVMQVV